MEDFPVGASRDRHAKWYATDLIYDSKGKAIRKTPGGGSWNLRETKCFDDFKILISGTKKNNCKVAFYKKKFQYRKGKERTGWMMIEYTMGEVQARFAICQIFPVQPIEPSQDDDVLLAAPAVGATDHATSVPVTGPHLQEVQCTAVVAQDLYGYIQKQQTAFEIPAANSIVEGNQLQ